MISSNRFAVNPQITEFLRLNPLPPELEGLRPVIEKFKDVDSLLAAIFQLSAGGYSSAQIEAALLALGKHLEDEAARCVTCLDWTETGDLVVVPHPAQPVVLRVCPRCVRRFESGRPTAAMRRNFVAYAKGGVA